MNYYSHYAGSAVLTEVTINGVVFWVAMPCSCDYTVLQSEILRSLFFILLGALSILRGKARMKETTGKTKIRWVENIKMDL
jgi:hypothetical protein